MASQQESRTGSGPVTPGSTPPRPGRIPLVDNTLAMVRDPLGFYDRVGAMDADVVGYNVAGTTGYFVTHPDLVEQILVTDAASYEKGALLQRSLGSTSARACSCWKARSGRNSAPRSSPPSTGRRSPPTAGR